jgi:hypothetical protein
MNNIIRRVGYGLRVRMGILAVRVTVLWRRVGTRRMRVLRVGIVMVGGWWVMLDVLIVWPGTRGRITTALGSDPG